MAADLYSQDPRERLAPARLLAPWTPDERFSRWPLHWFGTANAWLVFIGPSPGDSPGASPVNWDRDRLPTLGRPNEQFASYRDSSGFWSRVRDWTAHAFADAGVFTEARDAWSVAMLGNIASSQAGDAATILDGVTPRSEQHS